MSTFKMSAVRIKQCFTSMCHGLCEHQCYFSDGLQLTLLLGRVLSILSSVPWQCFLSDIPPSYTLVEIWDNMKPKYARGFSLSWFSKSEFSGPLTQFVTLLASPALHLAYSETVDKKPLWVTQFLYQNTYGGCRALKRLSQMCIFLMTLDHIFM